MKKLVFLLAAIAILMVLLIVAAFFYVDVSGHVGYRYTMFLEDASVGSIRIDRYVTEEKIIYKSITKYSDFGEYSEIIEKLVLDKKKLSPLEFEKKSEKNHGGKCMTLFVSNEGKYDLLFLDPPEFITFEEIKYNAKDVIFSPKDVMLYMPLIEKYNFWKKGTQFFDLLILIDGTVPPIEEKIEIRYLKDEYIPVGGCKTEAESFVIKSELLPEIKIFLSKYKHRILCVEINKGKIKFELTSCIEGPEKKIESLRKKIVSVMESLKIIAKEEKRIREFSSENHAKENAVGQEKKSGKINKHKIFFESGDSLLAGKIWIPAGEGKFPGIIISPKETSGFMGERDIPDLFGEFFSKAGFITLMFDNPEQGKSHGSVIWLSDEKKIENIEAASEFLLKHPSSMKDRITLIGPPGGAYPALEGASRVSAINSCVLLDLPLNPEKYGLSAEESIEKELNATWAKNGLEVVSADILRLNAKVIKKWREELIRKSEKTSFFLDVKVPVKEYKDFLSRDSYNAVIGFGKPLLLIFEKENTLFDSRAVNFLRKLINENKSLAKVQIVRDFGLSLVLSSKNETSRNLAAQNDVCEHAVKWILENNIQKKVETIAKTYSVNTMST